MIPGTELSSDGTVRRTGGQYPKGRHHKLSADEGSGRELANRSVPSYRGVASEINPS